MVHNACFDELQLTWVVCMVPISLRCITEEQLGGPNPRDPRRAGQGKLHHLLAAAPQGLGHTAPLLQQHG